MSEAAALSRLSDSNIVLANAITIMGDAVDRLADAVQAMAPKQDNPEVDLSLPPEFTATFGPVDVAPSE